MINYMNKIQDLLLGVILAKLSCEGYKILSNKPIYIDDFRIHHYKAGLAILLLAFLKKDFLFIALHLIL